MVPLEFVEMLAMTPFAGNPDVAVGRLPDGLASDLALGADARIIGSLISPRSSLSALVMQGRPASVRERLITRLVEQGWKQLAAPSARGGFETELRQGGAPTLCSPDGDNIQLIVSGHRGDSTAVRLFLASGDLGVSCADPELTSTRMPSEELPMPALYAPTGTTYRGGGAGGGTTDSNARGRLRTDMEPAALVEHYAAQMVAAGWQVGAQATSTGAALRVFRKTDDSRVTWQGVLYVIALPDNERELYLRVTRDR
jgi:hypothetical protein